MFSKFLNHALYVWLLIISANVPTSSAHPLFTACIKILDKPGHSVVNFYNFAVSLFYACILFNDISAINACAYT